MQRRKLYLQIIFTKIINEIVSEETQRILEITTLIETYWNHMLVRGL